MQRFVLLLVLLPLCLPVGALGGSAHDFYAAVARKKASAGGALVAQWFFENDLTDEIGSLDLTGVNSPTYESGSPLHGSYSLDLEASSTQYAKETDANLPASFPLKSGGSKYSFTWLCEIKPASHTSFMYIMGKWLVAGNKKSAALFINSDTNDINIIVSYDGTNIEIKNNLTDVVDGRVYQIAFAYNHSDRAYRLRVYDATTAKQWTDVAGWFDNQLTLTDADFIIGNRADGDRPFDGLVDRSAVADYAMTPAQIDAYFGR